MDARSGFRNRSNSSFCGIGSRLVIPEDVGDQGTGGGTTARADADAHAAGVADEVGDDEKVGGEAILDDDVQLLLDPLGVAVRRTVREAL
jgi:hypothetical protein